MIGLAIRILGSLPRGPAAPPAPPARPSREGPGTVIKGVAITPEVLGVMAGRRPAVIRAASPHLGVDDPRWHAPCDACTVLGRPCARHRAERNEEGNADTDEDMDGGATR